MVTTEQLSSGIRTVGAAAAIETTTVAQLAEVLKIERFAVVRNGAGKPFVHFIGPDNQYISAGVGPKVTDTVETVKDLGNLFKNYIIYTGESTNGRWFTFGPQPTSNEPVLEISAKDLLTTMKLTDLKKIA